MSGSDWLQMFIEIILGFISGVGVSWYFFRVQQVTDFNRLLEAITKNSSEQFDVRLKDIEREVRSTGETTRQSYQSEHLTSLKVDELVKNTTAIKESILLSEKIDMYQSLERLRSSIDGLSYEVVGLSSKILDDMLREQKELIEAVRADFARQADQSKRVVEDSVSRELQKILPSEQSKKHQEIMEVVIKIIEPAINGMGSYQSASIEGRLEELLNRVRNDVVEEVGKVSSEVQELKENLPSLPPPE